MGTRAHTVPKFYLRAFVAPESEGDRNPFLWIGSLATGEISRRSPKNVSISRGLYDGLGGFSQPGETIEAHLAKIESDASEAIRKFAAERMGAGAPIPLEVTRFLAWQAARTPGWMDLVQKWADEPLVARSQVVEPPPDGFASIRDRTRPMCLEDPKTGARCEVADENEFYALRNQGWKWILRRDDQLEMLHIQAWYFQVRHFPRLSWVRLHPPSDEEFFVTSDRAVAWIADGYANVPPAALRHPTALVVAPLTRSLLLIGRHGSERLQLTPREVNRVVAHAASDWIAGSSHAVVQQALADLAQVPKLQ